MSTEGIESSLDGMVTPAIDNIDDTLTQLLLPALKDIAAAIREHTAELKRQNHPSRCPCDACRDVP